MTLTEAAGERAVPFFLFLDRTGRIVSVDEACEQFTGRRSGDLCGALLCEALLLGSGSQAVRDYFASGATAPMLSVVCDCKMAGGCRRIACSLTQVPGEGTERLWVAAATDLGEQQQAERALLDSEQRYRELVENINDVLFELDERGAISYISPVVRALAGFAPSDLVGRVFTEYIHPDDVGNIRASLRRTIGGDLEPSEFRVFDARGRIRWIRSFSRPIFAEGRVVGVRGVLTDVTERKESDHALRERERHFRKLIENSSEIVTLMQATGVILYTGPSVRRILGYESHELVGRNGFDLVHPDDAAPSEAFQDLLGRPGERVTVQYRFLHKDGSWRWLEGIAANLLGDPSVGAIIVNSRDVTERRRAEEAARERQGELSRVLRMNTVGEMAAGLAHELNSPLSAIVNYANGCIHRLCAGDEGSAEVTHALREIVAEAMRAGDIIHGLKRLARKEPQRRDLCDVNDVVREAARWVEAEAGRRGIAVRLDLASELPPVRADRVQLEQVVLNLLLNGIEAMGANATPGAELSVRTARTAGGLEVAVSDRGEGIPIELEERVFSPFFTTKPGGVGMGLAISRAIIESHHGTLSLVSNGGRGTTFRFTLPVRAGGAAARADVVRS